MQWRDAWKSVMREDGELFVMIFGALRMHVWHASRLVSHGEVRVQCVHNYVCLIE